MSEQPPGWAVAPLGAVADVVRGVTYKKSEARSAPAPGYLPVLRATNIDGRLLLDTQMVYVPSRVVRPPQRVQVGDIIVAASSGSLSVVGKSAQLETPWDGAFGAFCSVVRPSPQIARGYLAHFVASPHTRRKWRALAQGTNINNLKSSDVAETYVPIPPFAEQQRIVAAIEEQFSRLDAGVATLERVRQKIQRMRMAVLSRATTLQGYTKVAFGEVLREPLRNGHSAKADPSGTVPVLTLTAVTRGDFSPSNMKMTAADPLRVRDLWIQPGDLFIERSNTAELVGTARLYRGPSDAAVYPDLIIRARVNEDVLPEYGELVLRSPVSRRYFRECAQGISGTMPKIDQGAIERLPFPLPPLEVQTAVVAGVEQSLTLLDDLDAQLAISGRRAASLRSSLLASAFSGKLVAQDPKDEPASVLLDHIAAERASSGEHRHRHTRQRRRKATA
jgi:type I restriction enzyme S subunit